MDESIEEGLDELVGEQPQPDTSVPSPEITKAPPFDLVPAVLGAGLGVARGLTVEAGREVPHLDVRYRQEHEPYRFEPDSDMTVCVTQANLYEIHPLTRSVSIRKLSPLTIEVTDNCVVYSQFGTNDHGQVISEYILLMAEGDEVPASIHFVLPDENGGNGVGGTYNIPLFWIKDRKLYRNFWDNTVDPHRQTKLWGGLEGHRGPMWWIKGYNALYNVGNGQKVYKDYTIGTDFKNLRTLIEKGQDGLSAPFSGEAQVQVETNGDEIEIYGNGCNRHWKIGTHGVGIVEDGLVRCLSDLSCHTLVNRELTPVSVLTSATTTAVVNEVSVSSGSAASATPVTGNVASDSLTGNTVSGWKDGSSDATMWRGGAHKNLSYIELMCQTIDSGSVVATDYYWVLGQAKAGSGGTPPATVTALCDVQQTTGITGATTQTVLKDLTSASVVTGLSPISVVTNVSHTDFTVVSGAAGSVSVYQATGTDHKFLTAPAEQMGDSGLSVVACPTEEGCPEPEE